MRPLANKRKRLWLRGRSSSTRRLDAPSHALNFARRHRKDYNARPVVIVGRSFEGDDDDFMKWRQHDVYGDALRIIVSSCKAHSENAAALLQTTLPAGWQLGPTFDHRVLQGCHDILAAAWRCEANSAQGVLTLERQLVYHDDVTRWLRWLQGQVAAWNTKPHLVRLVMTALANQNTVPGYAAETTLSESLKNWFNNVPWL